MFETKLFVIFGKEKSTLRDPSIWKPPLASIYLLDPFGSYCSIGDPSPKSMEKGYGLKSMRDVV